MSKIVIADTRNRSDDFVTNYFKLKCIKWVRSKLYSGDFQLANSTEVIIDIKSSGGDGLIEIAGNLCGSKKNHERIRRELTKAGELGCRDFIFLVVTNSASSIEYVSDWQIPSYKTTTFKWKNGKKVLNHYKGQPMIRVNPQSLAKAMTTMQAPNKYAEGMTVRFEFCTKEIAGQKILELLGV